MSPSPHKETRAYFAALKTNGVTATLHQQRSFDNFVRAGKLGGWLSTIQRLFLPVWGVAAANAVDAVLPSRSGTWVGTVSHANKCATGTTGALDSTWTPSTSGTTWPNIGIMLQTTTLLSEPAVLCGGPGGTGQTQMDQYDNVRTLFNIGASASGQIVAAYTTDQLLYGYGLTNNTKNLVTSTNGVAGKRDSNAIVDGDYPSLPMYFMASNLGAVSLPSARGFGAMGITHGVNTDAMAVAVASAVNTLVNKLRA
jgi:hypothetical protein